MQEHRRTASEAAYKSTQQDKTTFWSRDETSLDIVLVLSEAVLVIERC